jgi:SAM-dependent methyltransferase
MSHWVSTGISTAYRAFRPEYPRALFQGLLRAAVPPASAPAAPDRPFTVIDLGCGTGQATFGLADALANPPSDATSAVVSAAALVGVDPSATQVAEATRAAAAEPRRAGVSIQFTQGTEKNLHSALGGIFRSTAGAADVVVAAQAAHWMDIPTLCTAVAGVRLAEPPTGGADALLRQGGVLALISYPTSQLSLVLDPLDSPASLKANALLEALDTRLAEGKYWPPERAHLVEPHVYADIRRQIDAFPRAAPTDPDTSPFAFSPLPRCTYRERRTLSVEHLMKYLGTWSGVNRYVAATGDAALLERDVEIPLRRILSEQDLPSDSPHEDSIDVTFTFYLDMWRRN